MSTVQGIRDGKTFDVNKDLVRLNAQATKVFSVMESGKWFSLRELSDQTNAPEASVSARLRDFRKPKFGAHTVERQRRTNGTWEYRLIKAEEPS
jgi:hypothetical protein